MLELLKQRWQLGLCILGGVILLILLLVFLIKLIRGRKKAEPEEPHSLLYRNPGNDFPIEEFTRELLEFLFRLEDMPKRKRRFLFWKWDRVAESGSDFEIMALRAVQKSQDRHEEVPLEVEREVKISPGCRVDFLLKWRVSKTRWLMIIVECKHSFTLKTGREQYKRGTEQLKRYKNKLWNANLLLLLTDFRLPKTAKPFRIDGRILTVNYSIFEDLLDVINEFIQKKRREFRHEDEGAGSGE